MKVFIVTFMTAQGDTRIGAVYPTIEEARVEEARLDKSSPFLSALIVIRDMDVPRDRTPEQSREFFGYGWTPERGER